MNLKKKIETKAFPSDSYRDSPGTAEIERVVAKLDSLRNGSVKQVVLFTSAVSSEGKSSIASMVAISSAMHRNKPTLLIDFDMRRPQIHKNFSVDKIGGVAEILGAGLPLKSCVKESSVPNLLLLTSGKLNETTIKLLNSPRLEKLFAEVRETFDHVIIDSPPIIPVSEPLIIGKMVDHLLLVVKAGATPRHVVQRAIDMLHDVKVTISGIVLNNMDNVLPYYYDYDYYGYKYFSTPQLELENNTKASTNREDNHDS